MRTKLPKLVLALALFGLLIPTAGCKLPRALSNAGYSGSDFGFDFAFDLGSLFYDDAGYYDDGYSYDDGYYYDDYGYDGYDDYYYDDGSGYWDDWKGKKPGKKK